MTESKVTKREKAVEESDAANLKETAEGVLTTERNSNLERQLEVARAMMKERAAALRELSKSISDRRLRSSSNPPLPYHFTSKQNRNLTISMLQRI